MKKRLLLFIMLFNLPIFVFAKETLPSEEILTKEEKYYKTIIIYNNKNISGLNSISNMPIFYTTEIAKEEYDSVNNTNSLNETAYVETDYKKLTTSIVKNSSNYRYKAELNWKNFPKVRSYDIIAIGKYASVKIVGTPYFSLTSCTSISNCVTTTNAVKQTFANGAGASFKLPSETNLVSLKATYYYDVSKNVDATIMTQKAYGDYSHATSSVSSSQAQKYNVSTSISLESSVISYYDEINSAIATWNGNW